MINYVNKKMVKKVLIMAFSLIFISTAFYTTGYASEPANLEKHVENSEGMGISSGSYKGTAFNPDSYSLSNYNGKYVNFWIRNNGNVNVKITINGSVERVFEPNESGHIFAVFSSDIDEDFLLKAVPTPNGGKIDIDYSIAQRHTQ